MKKIISYKGVVYPWHCDHMGHMNVMWYMGKFDEAAWSFISETGLTMSKMREEEKGIVAAEHKLQYFKECLAGDLLTIKSHLLSISDKTMTMKHEMFFTETGDAVASAELICIYFDKKIRRAISFSDEIRGQLEAFL